MPSIFVSHSHLDNEFGLRLIGDLKARFGDDAVWYDASGGLHSGDEWVKQIFAEIEQREIFLVILSPHSMQQSHWVPREMDSAYYLHANEGKHLIPVMLAPCTPPLNWRALHTLDFTDPAQYAARLQMLLDDLARLTPAPRPATPIPANAVPTIIVDQMHRGDFTTITDAVIAARPGTQIRIRPGLYREGIVLDKPLELVGEGNRDDVVIAAKDTNVIRFITTAGRVTNLTLRQTDGGYFAVDCTQGRLVLEDCDITTQGNDGDGFHDGIGIHDGADPRIRRNRIHDGADGGINVYNQGQGLIENNEIFGNATPGIGISTRSSPIVRHNRIHDGKDVGIYVLNEGQGLIEDNEIFENATAGIAVAKGANPTVRRNTITRNRHRGIWITEMGGGIYEDNDLRGNDNGAWFISEDSKALVKRARNQE
jgi:parallel beta-helix repeat protein